MASSDRPYLIPVDCYAGMFGSAEDIRTGWGREPNPPPRAPYPSPEVLADVTWVGYGPSHVPWMEVLGSRMLEGKR